MSSNKDQDKVSDDIEISFTAADTNIDNDGNSKEAYVGSSDNSLDETSTHDVSMANEDYFSKKKTNTHNLFASNRNNLEQIISKELIEQEISEKKSNLLLAERYPVKLVIVYSIIIIILSLLCIIIQILMILNQSPLYYVGSGIWVAMYFFLSTTLNLLISTYKHKMNNFMFIYYFFFLKFKLKNVILIFSLLH